MGNNPLYNLLSIAYKQRNLPPFFFIHLGETERANESMSRGEPQREKEREKETPH